MMETVLDIDEQEVISRDNAMVVADAVAFYQVVDASKAAYEVKNLELALKKGATKDLSLIIGRINEQLAAALPQNIRRAFQTC